jgi:hypothetical protein
MQVNIKVDTSLLEKNAKRYVKNLAYSTAQAINDSAKAAQSDIRGGLKETFHIRNEQFMNRTIKIFSFANVSSNRPYAIIGVDNSKRHLLLSMFEEGGARLPFVGKNVAVPVSGQAARPSVSDSVNGEYTFQALNFTKGPIVKTHRGIDAWARHKIARSRGIKGRLASEYFVWQGAKRTFILFNTRRAPLGGVFQRVGPKRDDIRLIYSFKTNVRVRNSLNFGSTTERAFNNTFNEAFYARFYRLNK